MAGAGSASELHLQMRLVEFGGALADRRARGGGEQKRHPWETVKNIGACWKRIVIEIS